ncbi:SseB family protein [Streptomyces sp. NPDC089799]|uniref:SseB family protein n=1 Tax=Streptomyces sp. NPDC089799 TaxID=3155066 RepID=UPI003415C46D
MGLVEEIARMRAGEGEPASLVGEFRRTALLVPVVDGGLMSGFQGGVRWIHAFTDEEALARFAVARGMDATRELEYLAVLGARLVDGIVPGLDGPTGVALNVADQDGAMLFPPVSGIVPDAVAVDVRADPVRAEPAQTEGVARA